MLASVELQVISRLLVSEDQQEIDTLLSFSDNYYSIFNKHIEFIKDHVERYGQVPDVFTFQSNFPDIDLVRVDESLEYLVTGMRKNRQRILLLETFNKINELDTDDISEAWKYLGNQYDKASELEESKPMNIIKQAKERADQIVEFSKQTRIPTGFKEIDKVMYGGLSTVEELLVIIARTNSGKAQPMWSNVLTPQGWKKMIDIHVGDIVIGKDNDNGKVLELFPQGIVDYYKVHFTDGTYVECCGDHLWVVLDHSRRCRGNNNYNQRIILTTDELRYSLDNVYSVDLCGQVQFTSQFNKEEELDPYFLGVLLASVSVVNRNELRLHRVCEDVWNNLSSILDRYECYRSNRHRNRIIVGNPQDNVVVKKLKEYGLLHSKSISKFIPSCYLTAPVDVRLSLLAGLLDAAGYAVPSSRWQFSTSSDQLAEGFNELVRSLGIFTRVKKFNTIWNFSCVSEFNPFRIEEKSIRWIPSTKTGPVLGRNCKKIKSIEYIGKTECQCILIDNKSHTYITDGYTVTHNTWVTTKIMQTAQSNGFPVLFYSPEMQSSFLATRFDTWREHFKNSDIFNGRYSDEYIEYIQNLPEDETPAFIVEDKDLPDGVSVRSLSPLVKKYGIKLLIIDGLSYVKDDKKYSKDYDKYKHICTDLFNLSKQYGCAVVVTMQANRATQENKDENGEPFPNIYNAEGSDHPARIATQVFSIRQIFETKTLDIRMEKSRNAANTRPVFSYIWDVNTGHAEYVEDGNSVNVEQASTIDFVTPATRNTQDENQFFVGIDYDESDDDMVTF